MDEIVLVDYDPRWPALFGEEAERIRAALRTGTVLAVEHFGSTAVPGLRAKPIIDILVAVADLGAARAQAVPVLETLGYAFWADNPNPDHLFFVKGLPPKGPRTHHVHVVEPDAPGPRAAGSSFVDRLLFRDALRANADLAKRYEELKRALAERNQSDREAYTEGKTEFVLSVLEQAKRR